VDTGWASNPYFWAHLYQGASSLRRAFKHGRERPGPALLFTGRGPFLLFPHSPPQHPGRFSLSPGLFIDFPTRRHGSGAHLGRWPSQGALFAHFRSFWGTAKPPLVPGGPPPFQPFGRNRRVSANPFGGDFPGAGLQRLAGLRERPFYFLPHTLVFHPLLCFHPLGRAAWFNIWGALLGVKQRAAIFLNLRAHTRERPFWRKRGRLPEI